jgi:gamma-carbonic anhydrase
MIRAYDEKLPKIHDNCFIAESSDIIGDVEIDEGSSLWYRAVIRGDMNEIRIGKNTNIQDGAVIHCDSDAPTIIGNSVTVGHNAIIHGAAINDNVLIGMGAIVLNHAVIGEYTIVGAGAIITGGKEIPPRSLVLGSPGKVVRTLTEDEVKSIEKSAMTYLKLAEKSK